MPSGFRERAETVYLPFATCLKGKVHPELYHNERVLAFEETDGEARLLPGMSG